MDSKEKLNKCYEDACAAYEKGRMDDAAKGFRFLLERFDGAPLLHFNLGLVHYSLREFEDAEKCFFRATELAPEEAAFHFNLALSRRRLGKITAAIEDYLKAAGLDPQGADIFYNLAGCYRDIDDTDQAIATYARALEINPDFIRAHNNLAFLLHCAGNRDRALRHYREVVRLKPDHPGANYMLAALLGDNSVTGPPSAYVESLFNSFAGRFEHNLLQKLEYRVPEDLRKLFAEYGKGALVRETLDLGCGTGLCGLAFTGIVDNLDGVDLSPKMVEIAKKKKIYRDLIVADAERFLANTEKRFDLFLAADVLNYIGDLKSLLQHIVARSRPGALLLFSSETVEDGAFVLQENGRFAHSSAYLIECAAGAGFEIVIERKAPLRKERGEWEIGKLWLWRVLPSERSC